MKIFAPDASGLDSISDFETERFGLARANALGVASPKLFTHGIVRDAYDFPYLLMEKLPGCPLGEAEAALSNEEKRAVGRDLRRKTDRLNTACAPFNKIDVRRRALACPRYQAMPEAFQTERTAFLQSVSLPPLVFVHGDLNPDNLLIGENGRLAVIHFADALLAPPECELVALVCELFCFEKPYLDGFFGAYDADTLTERCFLGLLLHDFGQNMIRCNLGDPAEITSLAALKSRLRHAIETNSPL